MLGTIDGRIGDHNMLAPPFIVTSAGIAIDAVFAALPVG